MAEQFEPVGPSFLKRQKTEDKPDRPPQEARIAAVEDPDELVVYRSLEVETELAFNNR